LKVEELPRLPIERYASAPKMPVSLLLHNIRSLLNVGSILRSSDAFRVQKVYLSGFTGSPTQPEVQKTALGAQLVVPTERVENPIAFLQKMREKGMLIVAVEQTTHSLLLPQWKWDGSPTLFIFGNEMKGIEQELIDEAHFTIEIPQLGFKHSLNVAVSAGIILYHCFERALQLQRFSDLQQFYPQLVKG